MEIGLFQNLGFWLRDHTNHMVHDSYGILSFKLDSWLN